MRHEAEMRAILKQVELWPAEERIAFAREASALVEQVPSGPKPTIDELVGAGLGGRAVRPAATVPVEERGSFGDLLGIANPDGRTFSDAEVDDIRWQALKEKYLP